MTNVSTLFARPARQDAHQLALAELFRHRWESRAGALGRCIKHLMSAHDISQARAEMTAVQAYAELEATNERARIDIDASTANVVVLRPAEGAPVMLTVGDLLAMVERGRRDGRTLTVNGADDATAASRSE